jgi:hypothetical protein
MKHYLYDRATGHFTGATVSATDPADVAANVPPDCDAVAGDVDPLSQRFDVVEKRVVDWQPPAPDSDHEWNAQARRWRKRPEVVAAEQADQDARALIAAQEVAQGRAIREVVLKLAATLPADDPDRTRLEQIDQEIAAARPQIMRAPRGPRS